MFKLPYYRTVLLKWLLFCIFSNVIFKIFVAQRLNDLPWSHSSALLLFFVISSVFLAAIWSQFSPQKEK